MEYSQICDTAGEETVVGMAVHGKWAVGVVGEMKRDSWQRHRN
jgi:hypothetical protein